MVEDLFFDNLDTFDDIDTSDVDYNDITDGDSSFYDSFVASDESFWDDLDELDDFEGFVPDENTDEGMISPEQEHSHEHVNKSQISFGSLSGRCHHHNCLCKQFEGTYGAVCSNCYHGFDKHY